MVVIYWSLAGFICGSIPFSLIVGKLARKIDIREYGDQNPGAWNVMRSAGWYWGVVALLLDYLKGAIPVVLAWFWMGVQGWEIVPIAVSPVLGHAFSPFLGFKGGKAVATTFGVWSGLSIGTGPIVLGFLLGLFYFLLDSSAWAVMISFSFFGGFLAFYYLPIFPEFIWVWVGNLSILFWKHRRELAGTPRIRSSILRQIRRGK